MNTIFDIVIIALASLWGLGFLIWFIALLIKSKKPTPEEYALMEKERKEKLAKEPHPRIPKDNNIYYIPPFPFW